MFKGLKFCFRLYQGRSLETVCISFIFSFLVGSVAVQVEPVAKRNLLVLISLHSYRMTSDHIRV